MHDSPEFSEATPSESEEHSSVEIKEAQLEHIDDEELRHSKELMNQKRLELEKQLEEDENFPLVFMTITKQNDSENAAAYWNALKQIAMEKKLFTESDETREEILENVGMWLSAELRHARYGEKLQSHSTEAEQCDLHYLKLILEQKHSLSELQTAAQEAFQQEIVERVDTEPSDSDDEGIETLLVDPLSRDIQSESPNMATSSTTPAGSSSNKIRTPITSTKVRPSVQTPKTHEDAMAILHRASTTTQRPNSQ